MLHSMKADSTFIRKCECVWRPICLGRSTWCLEGVTSFQCYLAQRRSYTSPKGDPIWHISPRLQVILWDLAVLVHFGYHKIMPLTCKYQVESFNRNDVIYLTLIEKKGLPSGSQFQIIACRFHMKSLGRFASGSSCVNLRPERDTYFMHKPSIFRFVLEWIKSQFVDFRPGVAKIICLSPHSTWGHWWLPAWLQLPYGTRCCLSQGPLQSLPSLTPAVDRDDNI